MPARVIQASVGPGRPSTVPHDQVVVAAEEGVEAVLLGGPGHGQEVVVGGALLGLGEDAEVHAPGLVGARRAPGTHTASGRAQPMDRPRRCTPSSNSASAEPTSPIAMARSSLGRSGPTSTAAAAASGTGWRPAWRRRWARRPGTPCGATARTSRGSRAARAGGKAWSSAGLMEKLPLHVDAGGRRPRHQRRDPVGQAGDEDRAEQRGPEGAAQRAEEGDRGRAGADRSRRARRSGWPAP